MDPYIIIIYTGLLLGLATGFLMHRSDFCVAGMVRDLFLFSQPKKVIPIVIVVVTSMALFEGARLFGLLPLYPFPGLKPPSVMNLLGGFIFGIGMVLAGGCVVGVLYKAGAGNVLAMTALFGILAGCGIYAEAHPLWSTLLKTTTLTDTAITIPQLFHISPTLACLIVILPFVYLFMKWQRSGLFKMPTFAPQGYIRPVVTAILLALIGLISYLLVGRPMGITSSYAKMTAFVERLILPSYYETVSLYQLTTLKYNHPLTGELLTGGVGATFDAIAAIEMPLVMGILTGSFLSAVLLKEWRLYIHQPLRQYLSVFIGGILVGFASRATPSCNLYHIFGGLPIFNMQSILFLIGLLPGAWLGSRILTRFVIK